MPCLAHVHGVYTGPHRHDESEPETTTATRVVLPNDHTPKADLSRPSDEADGRDHADAIGTNATKVPHAWPRFSTHLGACRRRKPNAARLRSQDTSRRVSSTPIRSVRRCRLICPSPSAFAVGMPRIKKVELKYSTIVGLCSAARAPMAMSQRRTLPRQRVSIGIADRVSQQRTLPRQRVSIGIGDGMSSAGV